MRAWLSAIGAAVLGTAALFWGTDGFRALTAETARRIAVSEHPRAVPDLRLQLQSGAEARLRDLRGELVVATFIYTRCTTMCPMLGLRMKRIRAALPEGAAGAEVHLLSLSFDPEHDTPDRLAAYAGRYGARPGHWWVARPRKGLEGILDTFGVVVLPDGRDGFRHNGAFYLIDRAGRLTGIYPDDKPQRVAAAVEARL
ncbi:SCO family protein [Thiohalorhabdus sp. Cl-TMA]|uniref:SCO family protein n=1 Tax=Thiohalorhabdus methylotrophus TaxID=3242694 RepID=A0ABV4TXL4_9GAMM